MQTINRHQLEKLRVKYKMGFLSRNAPLVIELNELDVGDGLVVGLDEISPTMIRLGAGRINRFFKRYGEKQFSSRRLRGVDQITYIRIK